MSLPNLLALDTSTQACSVAIRKNNVTYSHHQMTPQTHANLLLGMIQDLMAEVNLEASQIDYLVYGEGPGAFTGIRIASGAIQGLALGWNKPVIAVSSLAAMAKSAINQQHKQTNQIRSFQWVSLMDARMQEIYFQEGACQLTNSETAVEWQESTVEMLNEEETNVRMINKILAFESDAQADEMLIFCGDIDKEYPQLVEHIQSVNSPQIVWLAALPHADAMLEVALSKLQSARTIDEELPKPVYLRNNVAETIEQRLAKKNR